MSPSYSPDGKYIAATRTTNLGTDVVILDASNGRELLRITNDGSSFSPSWSPAGDGIAYLHLDGQTVDLKLAQLEGDRAGLDGQGDHRPDRGLRPRRQLASGLVHPGRRAAAADAGTDRRTDAVRGGERQHRALTARPMASYLERLAARSAATGTVLCLGIDPDPAALPPGFSADLPGVERFATLLVEAAAPYAAAVKPNLAFFEAFGSAGMAALERIRATLPADLPVVADAKRGDIGSTAARQAVALFDVLGADAVTVNPYLGAEAIAPFLERADRFAYVLCRTSNPGAGELQDLARGRPTTPEAVPGEPLHRRVARLAAAWGPGGDRRARGRRDGARRSSPRSGPSPRVSRSSCPASGPRAGRSRRSSSTDRRRGTGRRAARRRPPRERLAGHRGRRRGLGRDGRSRDPFERVAAAAADWARRLPVLP